MKRKKIDFSRWHRKGSSTLEYVIVMAAAILLAGVLYSVMSSNDVAGIIKEKVMQALNGQSTGVNVAGGSPSNEPALKQPKPSHPNKPTHPAPPPANNNSNPFVEGLKTAGHVTLDFIGYYDAKAALTGVDENGNKIGWGERLVRGAMVLPIGKPVKGVKMAAKYGDDVLRYGKGYVDNLARKSKKVACGCPKRVTEAWSTIASKVDNMMSPHVKKIKQLYPDAKVGYRGSLATGVKYKTGGPFNPNDFDVDAFIVSDELAKKFRPGTRFRNARDIKELREISSELENAFSSTFSGYRTEPKKPFTFRIYTEAEFNKIVKGNGYKLID